MIKTRFLFVCSCCKALSLLSMLLCVMMFAVFSLITIEISAVQADNIVDDGFEPPVNIFLADSPWPMAHRGPYNQASSPYAGITKDDIVDTDHFESDGVPIFFLYSGQYANGDRVIWAAASREIIKIDPNGGKVTLIDKLPKESVANRVSGVYTMLDVDNNFYVVTGSVIDVYTDKVDGDPYSDILKARSFNVADHASAEWAEEPIIGLNMTYDGMIVIANEQGMVGVVSRDFNESYFVKVGDGEVVSNSVAVDENGGIYLVTSERMHRVQWNGNELTLSTDSGAWSADYETGPQNPSTGRLGPGSGSSPTLMGIDGQDKFVVITDGNDLMNIVLFWRDEIPEDWQSIAPGKDRRVAAEVRVRFGNRGVKATTSEQSVLVRGYGAVVVNNYYNIQFKDHFTDSFDALLVFLSNFNPIAPYGAEKFQWNPQSRELEKVWVNKKVSFPNGVPTMSVATGLVYCVGARNNNWTLEALDWETGRSVFSHKLGMLPRYNSIYSACEIGVEGNLITGTYDGFLYFGSK